MSSRSKLIYGASAIAFVFAVVGPAHAADAAADADAGSADIVVTADKAGLLERKPNDTVFGINKPLIETPRSASFASDTTLERYGIETIDQLTAISPGSFTASFFGVPGSLNIRGTLAENYFRGFKRVENRGTYSTPIGDAAEIQIVRGPPTPLYGPGKVGGMLNFLPKTAKSSGAYITEPVGSASLTVGSYNKKNATGEIGLPVSFGDVTGGVYAYGELEDSHSFYRGIYPERQTGEISADFDLGGGWSTSFGAMIYHSDGDVQTPGWNRLTKDLIDNQTYITGRNTTLVDSNGNGRLEPTEVSPGGFYPFTTALYTPYFGFPPATDPRFVLDTGVGTTKLSPRTVFISDQDFSKTLTQTYYFDLAKDLGGDKSLKFQLFADNLDNERFVTYGFPADYQAQIYETRLTYNFPLNLGVVTSKNFIGTSYRKHTATAKETFNSGLISISRRDLSVGPTPTDIFDSPFTPGGLDWENNIDSTWTDTGLFGTTDIMIGDRVNAILGGRYDHYDVKAQDSGIFSFTTPLLQEDTDGEFTYSGSLTYQTDWGFMPYVTYAKAAALELQQAGEIRPAAIQSDSYISKSELSEAGVKFQLLDKTLIGSIAAYRQKRVQSSGLNLISQPTIGKGVEYEFRYLATDNISFTLTGNFQRTKVVGPDHSVVYLPPYIVGADPLNSFGGAFLSFDFSTLPGRGGDYDYTLIPKRVASLYGTYTSDDYSWGNWGFTAGATYASETSGLLPGAPVYPSYTVANASAFIKYGKYQLTLNGNNLFDKLYFTPAQGVNSDLAVMPGKGREWWLTLKADF